MKFEKLCPYVRYAMHIRRNNDFDGIRHTYDYHLIYNFGLPFRFIISGVEYFIEKNGLLIFPPSEYIFHADGHNCDMFSLNFDLDTAFEGYGAVRPDLLENYNPEKLLSPLRIPPFDKVFFLPNAEFVFERIRNIVSLYQAGYDYSAVLISAEMKYILVLLTEYCPYGENQLPMLVRDVREYLDKNFLTDIENKEIARNFGFHPNALNRLFLRCFGITIHSYIKRKRIEYACRLLSMTDDKIERIAENCGFHGASYFSEAFRQEKGISPSKYRAQAGQIPERQNRTYTFPFRNSKL